MTVIMGILNVTPDSFSDGGKYLDAEAALDHALALRDAGAAVIDVGGESTRPGSEPVGADEEQRRVLPVIEALVARGVPVSVDTRRASTAREAVATGAVMVNDVSGGLADPDMPRTIAETGVVYVAMHSRGPAANPGEYRDVVTEVRTELKDRIAALIVAGVDPARVVIDPGLGFSKNGVENWALLRALPEFGTLGHRILVGASRKRFLGEFFPEGAAVELRDVPTALVSALAAQAGAWAVRVHDVAATRLALDVVDSWNGAPPTHALRGGRGGEQAGDDARDATTQDELESGAPAESEAAE
ncbi:dihydropteroate synthase [uncultured Schumannella sp.]|uniref:dihydropteroate synthase n=1 Tax=uncultured Schumannella sp. TaxID=1195956 RepID=UPI0025FC2577|nr:dihydropteroate synthase [uncultured Schumannella sp.]